MTDHNNHDEQRISKLLQATQHNPAPVDAMLLARLRQKTLEIVESEQASPSSEPARQKSAVRTRTVSLWSRPMARFGMSLATAAMLVAGLALMTWLKPEPELTLGEGFAQIEKLQSFQATFRTASAIETVRYAQPAMLRIDHGASYILHRDGQSWDVNEADNKAARRQQQLFKGSQLNVAGLLRLPRGVDLNEAPVQVRLVQPGIEERLYHLGRSTLELRWLVDRATKRTLKYILIDQGAQPAREEEFTLTSMNAPVSAELFQLKDTLTEDGRVGVVQDIQGIVAVRPVGKERWTPLAVGDLLKPGDLVRANPRGPNAARLRMVPNTDVTFGPGATLELKSPTVYRLLTGEIEVHPRGRKVTVVSPAASGNDKTVVDAKTVLQAEAEKLTVLKEQPAWLKGFQGTVVNESLGQLLAKVDERNVPLNVGYHKVDVEIRDGLARTTVEESFINTTDRELEGTFFFPLPSDASIAGFGMWIGNELVEADIVEKQRAREIFDIILSEKKDPALLEWAGGNLFKTRVYPIPARGEKRIKITYTQALPLEGNRFRYSYALLSDLLKQHPLKELKVTMTVSSALPLAKVYSSTHPVREEKVGTAARLVFTAQEYVPTRDFEAVIELASTPGPVTLLPHRRGDDGYFLLRVSPPQSNAGWEREVVRDGPPLHLLILCDTSASIDKQQRSQQRAFVDALLGSLTGRDTFNLACFDVETDWAFAQQQNAEGKAISQALTMLGGRRSMGWTDFEKAFSSAQSMAAFTPGTVIVYLGDGVPAMSWGHDPKMLVYRLKGLVNRQKSPVHAVALGSMHEPQTLRAMASLSGGSWRKIAADRGPALQARDLLQELTDPHLLHDLKVSFEGLQTAKVYPETLPNVQQGTGLVLTGRYLPSGKTQSGKVIVSGLRGNTPVKYEASITLPDGDAGNSFIPRLWARQHIESLLETGGSAAREEIIARSEEFHLMTPYTSMLVLENDTMRERFAVKKRFNMRDGERFFADSKTQSELLLRQKQMKLAADWRVNLQKQALTQLATLGKFQQMMPRRMPSPYIRTLSASDGRVNLNMAENFRYLGENEAEYETGSLNVGASIGGYSGGMGGIEGSYMGITNTRWSGGMGGGGGIGRPMGGMEVSNASDGPMSGIAPPGQPDQMYYYDSGLSSVTGSSVIGSNRRGDFDGSDPMARGYDDSKNFFASPGEPMAGERVWGSPRLTMFNGQASSFDDESVYSQGWAESFSKTRGMRGVDLLDDSLSMESDYLMAGRYRRRNQSYSRVAYYPLNLQQLFPSLGVAPLISKPVVGKPPVWSPEIVAIVKSLDQRAKLRALQSTTLMIERVVETYEPRRNAVQQIQKRTEYLSDKGWHTIQVNDQAPTLLDWCTATERAALNLTFFTGRQRASSQPEREQLPIDWDDKSLEDLTLTFGQLPATLEKLPGNRVKITLTYPDRRAVIWTIDIDRQVLVAVEHLREGKVQLRVVYEDFRQVAGRWWATRRTLYDNQGRVQTQAVQKVQAVAEDVFSKALTEAKKQQALCVTLPGPLPTLVDAKKATAPGGNGGAVEHLIMLSHFASTQQWSRVMTHLAQLERLPQKFAVTPWIRLLVLNASRDHATLQNEVWKHAQALQKQPLASPNDNWYLFIFLQNQLTGIATANEVLRFVEAHQAIYHNQAAHLRTNREYQKIWAQYLANANRREEALAIWKQLAESDVYETTTQWNYLTALLQVNDLETAQRYLSMLLEPGREVFVNPQDSQQYWQQIFIKLHELGRYADTFSFASEWMKREPTHRESYQAYLLSLILTEQSEEFNRTQMEWIKTGPGSKSGTVQDYQFDSALSLALNHSRFGFEHQWQLQMDEKLHAPLIAYATAYLSDPRQVNNVHMVLGSPAGGSASGMALREGMLTRIIEEAATLSVEKLQAMVQNAAYVTFRSDDIAKEQKKQWNQVAETLKTRWLGLEDSKARYAMGNLLSTVLQRIGQPGYIAFLRERLKHEVAEYRLEHLNQLYSQLFHQEFTAAVESELFSLLLQLDSPDQPAGLALAARSQRLTVLCDKLFAVRSSKLQDAIPEKGKLDRVKLAEKQLAATNQAHRDTAQRLMQPDAKLQTLVPWVEAEMLYHRIKAGDDLGAVAESTWKAYEAVPQNVRKATEEKIKTVEELDQLRIDVLHEGLRDRHLTVLAYLASQLAAKQPAVSEKLKSFIQGKMQAEPSSPYWKQHWQQLLIALNQPKELEASLKEWLLTSGTDQRYRLLLAYLQAERGGVQEAVDLMEKVKAEDELAPADWRALSDWLLVLNQQARHHQAKAQQYSSASEQTLYHFMQYQHALVSRQGQNVPQKLDEDTFLVIPELFRKSQYPANYFYLVQQLYEATKDFRLLAGLADSTLGHTPARVYPMLQSWRGLIQLLQEEATLDELDKRIGELRKGSNSNVDRRALDLLEAFLHRKAATQINQPGEHAKKAVECLARAMKHDWQSEEPAALAKLFYNLQQEDHAAWKEQLTASFNKLMELTAPGSPERVEVTFYYTAYHANPMQLLLQGIDEVRSKQPSGVLPEYSRLIVGDYLGRSVGHDMTAEAFALAELKRPGYSSASQEWFKNQLHGIYQRAYQTGGRVSLGTGQELYRALEALFFKELQSSASQERRYHYLGILSSLYRDARNNKQPTVSGDCKSMLMERVLPVLKSLSYQRKEIVVNLASTLFEIAGKNEGMQFLLDEYDRAPFSARRLRYDAWEAYQHYLATWRSEVTDAALLDRYFRIVIQRLTNYLVHGTNQNEVFLKGHQHYWAEKEEAFAATAVTVFTAREPTPGLAERVAHYLRAGIVKPAKAVDFLKSIRTTAAFNEKLHYELAGCLMDINQHQQAVVELKQLYAAKPMLRYGLRLMGCYHVLNQRDELQRMLASVEKEYAPKGVWLVGNLERIAQTCYETKLYHDAERLYGILIPQYRREHNDKNLNQDSLWNYYRYQALTLIELDKTGPALESISSAIVLWGGSFQQRADVLDSLRTVMRRAKDPQTVINFLDGEAKKNQGRENVLLRRMLAEVLMENQKHGLAVSQLKLILELKPEDDAASRLLIQAYDALGQPAEALQAALHRSEFVNRQTATWKELGERFSKQKDNVQAERAFTSMIEVLPNDADAEMALAQVRESQNRWEEAIALWKLGQDYRAEDPSGLLGLAKAYVHEKRWPEAKATLELLRKPAKPWHQRFDGLKVKEQVEELGKRVP